MTLTEKAAQTVLNRCLDVKREESVLIITNEPILDIARILLQAALKRTKQAHILQLGHFHRQEELAPSIARLMCETPVIIAATSPSISHTDARRKASRAGSRIASMPNITPATFSRIANCNFDKVGRLSNKLKDILTMAQEATITAPNGTELYVPLKNRDGYSDTGMVTTPGAFSNLPAGEASIAPTDGGTEGLLIVDSGMGVNQKDQDHISITIKDGRASRISGSPTAKRLSQMLSKYGPNARHVAEFGMGTNDSARISGYSLEDEKVRGTIHIALGNNVSFGGENKINIHLDAVVYKPTVDIDGRRIIDKGRIVLE